MSELNLTNLIENDLPRWKESDDSRNFSTLESTGETKIKRFLGADTFNQEISPGYFLLAYAMKYLTDVVRADKDVVLVPIGSGEEYRKGKTPEELVVFDGYISVYKSASLEQNVIAPNLLISGRLWFSRKPKRIFATNLGLLNGIFPNCKTDSEYEERLKGIIEFYQKREHEAYERSISRDHRSFIAGKSAARRSDPPFDL